MKLIERYEIPWFALHYRSGKEHGPFESKADVENYLKCFYKSTCKDFVILAALYDNDFILVKYIID